MILTDWLLEQRQVVGDVRSAHGDERVEIGRRHVERVDLQLPSRPTRLAEVRQGSGGEVIDDIDRSEKTAG